MVTRRTDACQTPDWRRELSRAFIRVADLLDDLQLQPAQIPGLDAERHGFSMLVPRGFAALMQRGDPRDPLLRQVLPLAEERLVVPGFSADPLDEQAADRGDGLLHKYAGRALLVTTGACAIHCRYCFRRHFPYQGLDASDKRWSRIADTLSQDSSLSELILSGGDPLMLDDSQLTALIARLDAIPHLTRLRLHSRMPVILPERITPQLCTLLAQTRLGVVCVVQVNHPNEIGAAAATALRRLGDAGVRLLTQSVLLRGVNDDLQTLCRLSDRVFDCGALPYYLHLLDPVAGAAHFQVEDAVAARLREGLIAHLPGYLVPRMVRESPGELAKRPAP